MQNASISGRECNMADGVDQGYNRYSEAYDRATRYYRIESAKGLQAVDGLQTSAELDAQATRYVEGEIDENELARQIDAYYTIRDGRAITPKSEEADRVTANIARVLSENGFSMSPKTLLGIHKRLFLGVNSIPERFGFAFRDYNITKAEPALAGHSVEYAPYHLISDMLDYDFGRFDVRKLASMEERAKLDYVADFVADIWQVHPFVEGNTRTVAVFLQQMLSNMGYKNITNDAFAKSSLAFRNALVRASYSNLGLGISEDKTYIRKFVRSVALGEVFPYRNRDMYCLELFETKGA